MHWRRKWQPTPVLLPGESRDGGAWWAAVYGVAQTRTRLKRLSSNRKVVKNYGRSFKQQLLEFRLLGHLVRRVFLEACGTFSSWLTVGVFSRLRPAPERMRSAVALRLPSAPGSGCEAGRRRPAPCGICAPQPRREPTSPELKGECSQTGP